MHLVLVHQWGATSAMLLQHSKIHDATPMLLANTAIKYAWNLSFKILTRKRPLSTTICLTKNPCMPDRGRGKLPEHLLAKGLIQFTQNAGQICWALHEHVCLKKTANMAAQWWGIFVVSREACPPLLYFLRNIRQTFEKTQHSQEHILKLMGGSESSSELIVLTGNLNIDGIHLLVCLYIPPCPRDSVIISSMSSPILH